jgi:hypothetical protein
MKIFSIIAALVLGFTTQAMAGTGASSTAKLNPGVAPALAHKYVPQYNIVDAKVVQGVKFENPATAKGFDPQPDPPGKAMFKSLPSRTE